MAVIKFDQRKNEYKKYFSKYVEFISLDDFIETVGISEQAHSIYKELIRKYNHNACAIDHMFDAINYYFISKDGKKLKEVTPELVSEFIIIDLEELMDAYLAQLKYDGDKSFWSEHFHYDLPLPYTATEVKVFQISDWQSKQLEANIPPIDDWGHVATDLIKLQMLGAVVDLNTIYKD